MIVQSSNKPIILSFSDDSVQNFSDLRITLWSKGGQLLKLWTRANVTVDGNLVTCPLTQTETANFPIGNATLEIKWLDPESYTEFHKEVKIKVTKRNDKAVMGVG